MRCWVDKLTTPVGDITPGRLLQTVRRLLTMEHDPYRHASTFSLFPSFLSFFLVPWEFSTPRSQVCKTARATENEGGRSMGKRKAGRSTEALGEYGSCRDDEACDATGSLLGHFP